MHNDDMPIPESEQSGERLIAGRYRLRQVIGTGSMGTMWSAYDEFLHRNVAVKEVRLPPGIPRQEADALRERTLREARATAMLSHPNVVVLHDVVRDNGEPFVVMELLASNSLAELIQLRGPLTIEQAAAVADAVASALEAAHEVGITHRDVKPGNVLIGNGGRIKLTDFGIARNVAETTMTSTGIILGSPAFIAPEVASGRKVTPAADQWSLGATLFAAIEGKPPYDADDDPLRTVTEVVHGEVPTPHHAGELAPIISGLMVKDPEQRMPLTEVRRQVRALLPEQSDVLFPELGIVKPTTPPRSSVRKPAARITSDTNSLLAADPGPLPFAINTGNQGSRRSSSRTALLIVLAVVLFVITAAGGFTVVRSMAGVSLLPHRITASATPSAPPSISLTQTTGTATTSTAASGGSFSLLAPAGWQQFIEQQTSDSSIPASAVVHFVSSNGAEELTVQRFPYYYPGNTIKGYLVDLEQREPGYANAFGPSTFAISGITGRENAVELGYRTVEPAANGESKPSGTMGQLRSAFAAIIPTSSDLWVVTLTVPTDAEGVGRDLFDQITPHFHINS